MRTDGRSCEPRKYCMYYFDDELTNTDVFRNDWEILCTRNATATCIYRNGEKERESTKRMSISAAAAHTHTVREWRKRANVANGDGRFSCFVLVQRQRLLLDYFSSVTARTAVRMLKRANCIINSSDSFLWKCVMIYLDEMAKMKSWNNMSAGGRSICILFQICSPRNLVWVQPTPLHNKSEISREEGERERECARVPTWISTIVSTADRERERIWFERVWNAKFWRLTNGIEQTSE